MPTYADLLRLFEQSAEQANRDERRIVLELPRPLEEIFPEVLQPQSSVTPLQEALKKEYEHLVTAAFNAR
jgi:hypothetical protein